MKTCKQCGQQLEDDAKFCPNCGEKIEEETFDDVIDSINEASQELTGKTEDDIVEAEVVESQEEPEEKEEAPKAKEVWYYVANNESVGPYSRAQMESLLANGVINGNTYVWKNGMADWEQLKNTELQPVYSSFVQETPVHADSYQNTYTPVQSRLIEEHNIVIDVVLTLILCGLYQLYWIYREAKDVNALLASKGEKELTSPGMVVLLDIVTCGVYKVYFFWRASNALTGLEFNGKTIKNNTAALTILSVLAPVVAFAILQSILNDAA
jgi:RNA polymerase subunit RPABC4/transcription elongation factor Spt4